MDSIATPGANARIASTEIGLDVRNASPPTQTYVGKDDSLWVGIASPISSLTVTVNARYLMPDGSIQLNQFPLNVTPTRAMAYSQINLPECFLLSVAATCNSTPGGAGQVFIEIVLSRFAPSLFNASQVLCQGYSNFNQPVSWPGGVNYTSLDCRGVIYPPAVSAPAAGANFSITVPTNAKWKPLSLFFQLSASAAVANRFPTLVMDNGSSIFAKASNTNAITAATTWTVTASPSPISGNATVFIISMGFFQDVYLYPNYRIRSLIDNIQALDQISAITLLVEEWLIP